MELEEPREMDLLVELEEPREIEVLVAELEDLGQHSRMASAMEPVVGPLGHVNPRYGRTIE